MKKENETLKNELQLMKIAKANSGMSELDPMYLEKLDDIYAEKAKAVSYTHLDVYKRQVLYTK